MQYKHVIGYLRLSQDDADKEDESNSITNQRILIKCFVEQNQELKDMKPIFFSDDGYTGTSFNRPGFKEMMEFVKKGESCCIIVKDIARLGRDTIDTQRYIEKVFPFMQVRFIAINDYYDSDDAIGTRKDTEIKFKNLINGIYPQICSKQIKQVKRKQAEAGKYCGSMPPYGYLFKGEDKSALVLDQEAAKIVRFIFDEKLKRTTNIDIAKMLNEREILTPSEYLKSKGFVYAAPKCLPVWRGYTIKRIIYNPVYTGMVVNHKTENTIVAAKSLVSIPREEWICVPRHEAIITMEEFDEISSLKNPCKQGAKRAVPRNIFRGKLRCGYCGSLMRTRDEKRMKTIKSYCTTPESAENVMCYRGKVLQSELKELILKLVRQQASIAEDTLKRVKEVNKTLDIPALKRKQQDKEYKIDTCKQEKMSLYERYVEGDISKDAFKQEKEKLSQRQKHYQKKAAELNEKIAMAEVEKEKEHSQALKTFAKYTEVEELTFAIVQELVEVINYYDPEHIEVVWKYQDEFLQISESYYYKEDMPSDVGEKI